MYQSIYMMFLVLLLTGSAYGQDCKCTNERPTNAQEYSCIQQAEWGKCERPYMEGFCQASCGTCDCPCVDTPPADGDATCEERASWGACEKVWMIDGYYCAKTCGYCGSGGVATAAVVADDDVEKKPVAEVSTNEPLPASTPAPAVTVVETPTVVEVTTPVATPTPTPDPVVVPTPAAVSTVSAEEAVTAAVVQPVAVVTPDPVVADEELDTAAVDPTLPVDPTDPTAPGATATVTATAATPVVVPSPIPTPAPLVRTVPTAPVEPEPLPNEPCKTVYEIMSEDPELSTSFEIWNTVRDMQAQGYDDETTEFTIFVPTNDAWGNYTFERSMPLPELLQNEPMLDRLVTFHEMPEPTLTTDWRHGLNLRSELRDIYNKRIIVLVSMPNGLAEDVGLIAETKPIIVERDIPACSAVLMKLGGVLVPSAARLPPLETAAVN